MTAAVLESDRLIAKVWHRSISTQRNRLRLTVTMPVLLGSLGLLSRKRDRQPALAPEQNLVPRTRRLHHALQDQLYQHPGTCRHQAQDIRIIASRNRLHSTMGEVRTGIRSWGSLACWRISKQSCFEEPTAIMPLHSLEPLPRETEDATEIRRHSRIGLTLFAAYATLYLIFLMFNAFAPGWMAATPIAGLNIALLTGIGLIITAVIFATLFGFLCRPIRSSGQ